MWDLRDVKLGFPHSTARELGDLCVSLARGRKVERRAPTWRTFKEKEKRSRKKGCGPRDEGSLSFLYTTQTVLLLSASL